MATKLERTLGASLAGSYGRGPATGVDYFSDTGRSMGEANINPGLSNLSDDNSAPDAGARSAIPEPLGGMGGMGGMNRSGGSFDTGGRDVGSFRGVSEADAGRLGAMGLGATMMGIATRDPNLAQFGGALGAGAQATQSNFGPAGSFIGGMLGGAGGAMAGGLAGRALSPGGITAKDAANTALGYAMPAYGLANAVTGGRIGNAFFGTDAGLAPGGAMTAPAQPGSLTGLSWGQQNIGRTVDSRGMPTSGTQVGQVADPAGYSFSSVTSPTGLAGQMGQVTAMPTGFNMTTAPPSINAYLGPAEFGSGGIGGKSFNSSDLGGGTSYGFNSPSLSLGNTRAGGGGGGTTSSTGGSYGGGRSGTNAGGTRSDGRSSGGGRGADGWADGGLIGQDQPGIPTSYAGGQTPMLAQGYNEGGEVAAGMPGMPQQQMMGAQPNAQQVNTQINQMIRDPQVRQQMVMRAQQLMQTGELTPQEVMTMAQVAEAALYNPSLYPQLRQFVMEQGMSPLPASFDPNVVMKIIAVSRALQQEQPATPPGQVPPTDQAQMQQPVPGMANGGYLRGPGTGRSDSIGTVNETTGEPVKVANGEYVIPAHVVKAKGREFFDNLLRRYADLPKGEAS